MNPLQQTKCPRRRPLSVWDFPKLATSVHTFRTGRKNTSTLKVRPHYPKILAFVYRNRLAVADQIQRRFPELFKSDRTARRQLAEMESLGLLGVQPINGVSPLMPKVYFVTRKGLRLLRDAYSKLGNEWAPSIADRRRGRGQSFDHVWHELAVTEFLLGVHEAVRSRSDLQLPVVERRSLVDHAALRITIGSRPTRLQPDGLFVFRQNGRGMMCCLVEVDTGSESTTQIKRKLRKYATWSESRLAREFLSDLYTTHGASRPQTVFRLLLVVCGSVTESPTSRVKHLLTRLPNLAPRNLDTIWMTDSASLGQGSHDQPIWICARDFTDGGSRQRIHDALKLRRVALLPQPAIHVAVKSA